MLCGLCGPLRLCAEYSNLIELEPAIESLCSRLNSKAPSTIVMASHS